MPGPRLLPRRLLLAIACVSAPALLALALLVMTDRVAAWPALIAGIGTIAGLALLIRPHLLHLEAVADYIRSMAADGGVARGKAPPVPRGPGPSALAPELSDAAAEAGHAWNDRRHELEAVVTANETILASLPDPLIMLDDERRIVRANHAAETLLGRSLAGRDLITVLRNPPLIEAVDAALVGGPGRVVEFSLPVPVERVFSARVEPLASRIADGTVALIALHDLTKIKRADQMRADFVANASHELRTPLSTLLGFIETLRGPARDDAEARDRFLTIMHDQASRMARLVADLLSLSRIELNEHSPPTGRVDLAHTLRSVADTLQFKAAEKSVTIRIAPDLTELPPVCGDADELAQVFQNLVDNAVKYGRGGSTVRVEGRAIPAGSFGDASRPQADRSIAAPRRVIGDAVAISVSDEGEGIAREHLSRLTERFYRVDTARSRDLGGTGLGLAIVKHIVNHHRGTLEIESTVGKGSRFTVLLPVAGEKIPASAPASQQ
ncbi:ATP-binding protein [Virgifigura deserti]|uniref:ATP-binding protein n=1 Tax=Virgifigura deserti TaxID=2268457 RepID=UPI003CCC2772